VGKDSDIRNKKEVMWCIRPAAADTDRLAGSLVLTSGEMALRLTIYMAN
jgi:hypothetical protein